MANNKGKIDNLHDQMPAAFDTRNNVVWKAMIESLGEQDQETMDLIESVRQQFFIKTATRPYIDRLGTANLVQRPRFVGMDDPTFRQFIPVMSYNPKQVKLVLDKLLDLFFFKESTTSFIQTAQASPFNLQDGWELEYIVDDYVDERIEFRAEEFTNIGAATADEVVAAINRQSSNSYAIAFEDSITKSIYIRIFTTTIGSKGSIEITGGAANIGFQFEGYNDGAGQGGNSQWQVTKVGDTVTLQFTGTGNSPGIDKVQVGDIVIITKPDSTSIDTYNNSQTFDSDTGFTYDAGKVEFSGSTLQQIDNTPTGSTFGASYNNDINGSWGQVASLIPTSTSGSPVITSNRLDLTAANSNVNYDVQGALNPSIGTIKWKYTPNYTGNPSSIKEFFYMSEAALNGNKMYLIQDTASAIRIHVYDNSGSHLVNNAPFGTKIFTAGVTYEMEYNYDFITGLHQLFIDGVQQGGNQAFTIARDNDLTSLVNFRVGGSTGSDFFLEDVVIFDTVQHTAPYTPGYSLPDTKYLATTVSLPDIVHSGEIQSIVSAIGTGANLPIIETPIFTGVNISTDLTFAASNTIQQGIDQLDVSYTALPGSVTLNQGSFIIDAVDPSADNITYKNLFAVEETFTQSLTNDVKFITPFKSKVFLKDRRAIIWEVRGGEVIVEMPPSPPVVKRNRKGASHINGIDSTVFNIVDSNTVQLNTFEDFPETGGQFFFIPVNEIQTYFPNDMDTSIFRFNNKLSSCMPIYTYTTRVGNELQGVSPDLPVLAAANTFNLVTADRDANNLLTVTTTAAHNFQVDDFAIIEGAVQGAETGLDTNGAWKITAINSATEFECYSFSGPFGTKTSTGGTIRVERIGAALDAGRVILRSAQIFEETKGPYMWDENADFVLSSLTAGLTKEIKAGTTQRNIEVTLNEIPNEDGRLIFDFGTEKQEGPVRYFFKPSDGSLALDPSYVFEYTHDIGSSVTKIRRRGGIQFDGFGSEISPYITDPAAARIVLQELMQELKSVGIFINFLVRYPEYFYATVDTYKSGVDPG